MSRLYSSHLKTDALAILLFHGVIPKQRYAVRNYTWKHIESARFTSILEDLARHGTPLSMPEVVNITRDGRPWPSNAFVITFDDGFANNREVAAPILEKMKIPGIFYVTTKFVGEGGCSWIDLIEYAVEQRRERAQVALPSLGIDQPFSNRVEKIDFLKASRKSVKTNRGIDPYDVAESIWRQLDVAPMNPDPDLDKKMSWSQVQELQDNPLFTVGGHGHTHRILSYLSPDQLKNEIDTSMLELSRHLKMPIEHYSYPEGLHYCYSPEVIGHLKRHDILCSPSAEDGVNPPGTDLFHLKRIMVA
jgi:peptidoglycan/xylan/chitin deacetylase (PgdA/CDA1 family)